LNDVVRARVGGATTISLLAAHFAKRKTKFGGGKARARREFLSLNPLFLPAPPERKLSKFSVRIFAEKSSDFVQDRQPSLTIRTLSFQNSKFVVFDSAAYLEHSQTFEIILPNLIHKLNPKSEICADPPPAAASGGCASQKIAPSF